VQCQNCGHVFADLQLTDEELADIYRKQYFFGEEYSDYVADRSIIQKNFKMRIKTLQRFIDPKKHQRLFEVGSAYGFFLNLARSYFKQVKGIDITEDGVSFARNQLKLDVIQEDLLKYDMVQEKFDVVCMWDTIEHLQQPDLYIEKISQHVEQGGLIALTTGDIDSLNARLKRDQWRLIHPPTHLHYFSIRTLKRLLQNYGFETIYARHCGFYRSVDNVLYNLLVLRYKMPKLYELIKKTGIARIDFYLNMYDIMYIIACKR
jgi:2-polyprenyl-3-methyl-5-hydroxy-6-metoxy-1,4-benzoquinol methylase